MFSISFHSLLYQMHLHKSGITISINLGLHKFEPFFLPNCYKTIETYELKSLTYLIKMMTMLPSECISIIDINITPFPC